MPNFVPTICQVDYVKPVSQTISCKKDTVTPSFSIAKSMQHLEFALNVYLGTTSKIRVESVDKSVSHPAIILGQSAAQFANSGTI